MEELSQIGYFFFNRLWCEKHMAAATDLSRYSEQLSCNYSLAQYLQDVVNDANLILSQCMFFFPWSHILENKSKPLLNILKELRDNASSNLLVENIETSEQAKRKSFVTLDSDQNHNFPIYKVSDIFFSFLFPCH